MAEKETDKKVTNPLNDYLVWIIYSKKIFISLKDISPLIVVVGM